MAWMVTRNVTVVLPVSVLRIEAFKDSKNRNVGFWASVGVRYGAAHPGSVGGWRASMPGERIVGVGRTNRKRWPI